MKDRKSPLHHAVILGYLEIAELLLENGACPNKAADDGKSTSLQLACIFNNESMARLLLDYGAKDYEEKARIEAVQNHKDNLVQVLLSNGKDMY